jgi:hypothetical protein
MTNATPASTNQLADGAPIELGDDILGIRGPVDIPTGWEWLLYSLAAIAVIALAYFLGRRLLRHVQVIKPPPIPYVAPHLIARKRLAAALRLIDDPYRFCSAVADALRGYFEGRFSIHAPDRTTDEFLDELRNATALNPNQQDLVAEFLTQCDLVKFARDEPTRNDLEQLHRFALGLVEETMPGSSQAEAVAAPAQPEVTR